MGCVASPNKLKQGSGRTVANEIKLSGGCKIFRGVCTPPRKSIYESQY
jgi:hypothetical protein